MKNIRKTRTAAALAVCLLLAACGTQQTAETQQTTETPDVSTESVKTTESDGSATREDEEQEPIKEPIIDFPFPFGMEEGCKLTLACIDANAGFYELRYYDKNGKLAQHLSCGQLREPIRFSYDDLANTDFAYDDLEIFSDGAKNGLLFIPDKTAIEAGRLFLEYAIEIPVYEELIGYREIPCTLEENETQWEKILYDINVDTKSTQPLRRMTLQKESGLLEIWDYLDERSVYSGEAARGEDGSLANPEYYYCLFSDGLYEIRNRSEADSTIPVWFSYTEGTETPIAEDREKNPFEKIQTTVFGNNGHMTEYEDRETFLTDFGFAGQEPFYCYYDRNGNLQLEFYLDEESGCGGGLLYQYHYNDRLQKEALLYGGFAFDAVSDATWEPSDPYRLTTVYGETGKESVDEYEEIIDYREDGKLDAFRSLGIIDWLNEDMEMPPDEKTTLIEINFIYREDGSLFYKDYSHNSRVFPTTYQSCDSYYDELERPVYETAYITHGTLEYYYIYDDAGKEPAYELCLDNNLGYFIPACIRFH